MSRITLRPGPRPDDKCRSCIYCAIQPSLLGFPTEERCIHPSTEVPPEGPGERVTYPSLDHARREAWPCGPTATLYEERRRG